MHIPEDIKIHVLFGVVICQELVAQCEHVTLLHTRFHAFAIARRAAACCMRQAQLPVPPWPRASFTGVVAACMCVGSKPMINSSLHLVNSLFTRGRGYWRCHLACWELCKPPFVHSRFGQAPPNPADMIDCLDPCQILSNHGRLEFLKVLTVFCLICCFATTTTRTKCLNCLLDGFGRLPGTPTQHSPSHGV